MKSLILATLACLCAGNAWADSTLADLIQNGRRVAALELIDKGADVNAAQGDGSTALHWAVYKIDVPLVERLLDRGAEPDAVNRFGSTPLAEAVKAGNAVLVAKLLAAGADANARNVDGQTVLMLAARTGFVEVAKQLVAHGADVNAVEQWRGQTALMWAAEQRFAEFTQYLIEQGADVHTRAAANDWGAQITSEPRAQYRPTGGLTPLLYAARSGCTGCVSAILAAGENVDRPTPDGVTALMIAIDNFEFDAANVLLDAGANPHYTDWWGRSALYLAVDMNTYVPRLPSANAGFEAGVDVTLSTETSAMDIMQRLFAADVEVNTQLNMHRPGRGGNSQRFNDDLLTTGATPLLRAAMTHDHASMQLLLAHDAQVDLPNVMGVTPLMAAAGVGVRNSNFGSNRSPNFEEDEQIEERVIASLEILLAAGADINASVTDIESRTARIARQSQMTERGGQTALHSAARRGWPRVVDFMLQHGVDVDVVDQRGDSPLEASLGGSDGRASASEEVAAILRNAGATAAAQ
jgi:ankyrin repeat protein